MSYDIYLNDPTTGETVELPELHGLRGGTYALGGTREAWLSVTYNYSVHFYRVLGKKGIRAIYEMTARESIPVLLEAAGLLKDDQHPDYWKATEGNARLAILNLVELARLVPPASVWRGD